MGSRAQQATGLATVALGMSQAFTPKLAAQAFGLPPLEQDGAVWVARLLGCSNMAFGAIALNDETRRAVRTQTLGLLAAEAVVTAVAGAKGAIPKRTAVSVLAFVAALVPTTLAD